MQPQLIAFDMDGTLIDTANLTTHDLVGLLNEYGIPMTYEHYLKTYFGLAGPNLLARLNADYGTTLEWAEFGPRRLARLPAIFAQGVDLAPGAEAMFMGLLERKIPFCIATNSPPGRNELVLTNLRLANESLRTYLHNNIHSAIDTGLNGKPRNQKPAPDIYLEVAQIYGANPADCLALEDGEPGMQSAIAAGFTGVGYIGLSTRPAEETEELKAAGAAHLLKHWDEFLPYLQSL